MLVDRTLGCGVLLAVVTNFTLPVDRMPESEVALRLAFCLLDLPGSEKRAEVALDGAQVQIKHKRIFPVSEFLAELGWARAAGESSRDWQGTYKKGPLTLAVHSRSGVGDVVCGVGGRRVRAECKKGPLTKKKGSQEYPSLRGALGQMLTVESVSDSDVLVVAVPLSPKFKELALTWRERPLLKRSGIAIVLVGRTGLVEGLPPWISGF